MPPMKYWEIVGDKLSAAGWSWGYCSTVAGDGWRWIVIFQIIGTDSEKLYGLREFTVTSFSPVCRRLRK
jgi:hypothetical protein